MEARKIFASVVDVNEIKQSDMYITVRARLFEATVANLNGVRVTTAFIDDIINNEEEYVGLPLCADVGNLVAGKYTELGHMYDPDTGEFHSSQIGCFISYEKEEQTADHKQNNVALIACARIMKRNKEVCDAVMELFSSNALKFSFELSCGSYAELADGTIQIDADKDNHFVGAAIVSYPACENAVALDLVAAVNEQEMLEGANKTMGQVEENVQVEIPACNDSIVITPENVNGPDAVNASVYKTTTTEQRVVEYAYDGETGAETRTEDLHSETHSSVEEAAQAVNAENSAEAEEPESTVVAEAEDTNAEEETEDVEAACGKKKKKCAEDDEEDEEKKVKAEIDLDFTELKQMMTTMASTIDSLRAELAEMKAAAPASVATVVASANNPFVGDEGMSIDNTDRYTLLKPIAKSTDFTLL